MIIGKCSLCGGDVSTPQHWASVLPAFPTCTKCGAVADTQQPVIKMQRPKHELLSTTSSGPYTPPTYTYELDKRI